MACKIFDGLFIGDAESSQDSEFIELNKISYVINTAGRQLPNLYELHGIRYLTYPWSDSPDFQIFDANGVVVMQLASFIDEGECDDNGDNDDLFMMLLVQSSNSSVPFFLSQHLMRGRLSSVTA